jgi:tetratricopeptide (TPR) repeat protein
VPRRIRLHQQVGKALEEEHGRRLDEHAAELAEHFVQSTEAGDLAKALRYSELAAQRAMGVFAYGEAVHHLEQALRTQEVLDPDDRLKRCDILLSQAEAMLPLEEPGRIAPSVAEEAFALAESLRDGDRAARAAILALNALMRADPRNLSRASAEFQLWAARADERAQIGTARRVYADLYRGLAELGLGHPSAAHPMFRRAVERAFQLGDPPLVFAATGWGLRHLNALQDQEMVEQLANEVQRRPRGEAPARDLGLSLYYAGFVLLRCGERVAAEATWGELEELAGRTHDLSLAVLTMLPPFNLAYLDGRLEEAIGRAESASSRAEGLGMAMVGWDASRSLAYLGRETTQAMEDWAGQGRPGEAARAVILAYLGRHQEAQAIRTRFGNVGSDADESGVMILLSLFEAAILGADQEIVGPLARRLTPLAGRLAFGPGGSITGSVDRFLGQAAALLGKPDEARAYYQQALEVCARVRFRPETALIQLHFAELLRDHYPTEQAEALERLDFAIEEFRAMKMQPYLERALRHKGLLHA